VRLAWLDAARGVGMALVIVGHMKLPPPLQCVIYAFHVPLFFIVTGYLYSTSRPAAAVAGAKARGLLVPYYLFSALLILLLAAFPGAWASACLQGRSWQDKVWPTLAGTMPVIEPTWFLPALFATSVAALPLRALGWRTGLAVLAVLLLLAQMWSSFRWPALPYRVHLVPMGAACLLVGMLWRRYAAWPQMAGSRLALLAVLALAVLVPSALWHGRVDMNANRLGSAVLFLATGTLGTAAVFWSCRALESAAPVLLAPLVYLGRRSLYLLAAHEPVAALSHVVFAGHAAVQHIRLDRLATLALLVAAVEILHGAAALVRRVLDTLRPPAAPEAPRG
jgi:fucose 4-O-acetylase-like acetyltransferase